jgi:TPR repeat protein
MRALWTAAMLLMLVMPGAAVADQFSDGLTAYNRQDYTTALRLWRLAAEQGNPDTQYNLGVMYADGRGVPKDDVLAVKWYRLAAEQGNPDAQNNLGAMYATGKGVPKDDVLAYMWFNIAAAQGSDASDKNRDRLARTMTPTQIAEAQRLSREWKAK